jgi:hypothetical protein
MFIGPGAVIVYINDRVCSYGCILCVDACTPRKLLFPFNCTVVFALLSDTGYQWAPLHVCRVESPSGSFLRSMG